ncbi:hypothetical protein LXL04_012546 [Taraxacum kok-saghyz]
MENSEVRFNITAGEVFWGRASIPDPILVPIIRATAPATEPFFVPETAIGKLESSPLLWVTIGLGSGSRVAGSRVHGGSRVGGLKPSTQTQPTNPFNYMGSRVHGSILGWRVDFGFMGQFSGSWTALQVQQKIVWTREECSVYEHASIYLLTSDYCKLDWARKKEGVTKLLNGARRPRGPTFFNDVKRIKQIMWAQIRWVSTLASFGRSGVRSQLEAMHPGFTPVVRGFPKERITYYKSHTNTMLVGLNTFIELPIMCSSSEASNSSDNLTSYSRPILHAFNAVPAYCRL